MSEQNYCYQCCLADICKHIDRGTHTLASPACDAFDPGMRWIPVTERLPEEDVNVLVAFDDGFIATTCIIDGEWELWADAGEATHWMPLPDAPEEDEDA